jgi:ribosomal protein S1
MAKNYFCGHVNDKNRSNPDDGFDWESYENGYNGYNLVKNETIKTRKGDKVFCHDSYAEELYKKMCGERIVQTTAKDEVVGALHHVVDINQRSDHEVVLDTDGGMSAVVDMNKETEFVDSIGCEGVDHFMMALKNPENKELILKFAKTAKVVQNRVSIMEGVRANVEMEFMNQLKGSQMFGYSAQIVSVNQGGFTVVVNGLKCFMPGSLAASGPIDDFDSMIGKNVDVCVVNYSKQTGNFVVSHKKYLELTLPNRVKNEMYPGLRVSVKVTGQSKNGLFCAIKDNNGDFPFSSLMHRSTMSPDMESSFDKHEFVNGDQFFAYVHRVDWSDDGKFRIVIGDKMPEIKEEEEQ